LLDTSLVFVWGMGGKGWEKGRDGEGDERTFCLASNLEHHVSTSFRSSFVGIEAGIGVVRDEEVMGDRRGPRLWVEGWWV